MAVLDLTIDMPAGVVYDSAKLKLMVTNYIYQLVSKENSSLRKGNVDGFMKLGGAIHSDIPFEEMRSRVVKERYGI